MAKKALLIGINRYRIPGADLRGCVNDVKNMQTVLIEYYGFAIKDITLLTDLEATTQRIKAAVADLLTGTQRGDTLLLHYSGHGSNVPDANGDEAERRDEILCPTDLDWKKPLPSDWLRRALNRVRAGVSLTVIMDSCHAGTNTRAIHSADAPVIERYLPNPWDLMAAESGRKLRGKVYSSLHASTASKRKEQNVINVKSPDLLLTGCQDTQTAADAYIGGSYNGAFTFCLVQTLRDAGGHISYRQLYERTLKRLQQEGFFQVPQLQGLATKFDRPFLSPE
jgi:metacaspase-1